MPKDFKPPKHVETHAYVFDRKTGEILATHTRWTDAGAEPPQQEVDRALLESVAKDSQRGVKDLDVLPARRRVASGVLRVDVKTRKLIVDRPIENDNILLAKPPQRP